MRRQTATAACLLATLAGTAAFPAVAGEFTLRTRSLLEGPARTMSAYGECLILGAGGGIAVFRDPRGFDNPVFLGIEGEPRDLVVRGTTLYIAAFAGGLRTIDLSDPARPVETHHYDIAKAVHCASAGNALFVADTRGILYIFALEKPSEPRFVGSQRLRYPVVSVPAEKNVVAAVYSTMFEIFCADSTGSLTKLSTVSLPATPKRAIIANGVLCVLTSAGEVLAWDIVRPEDPKQLEGFRRSAVLDIASDGASGALLGSARMIIPFEIARSGSRSASARIRVRQGLVLPVLAHVDRGTEPAGVASPGLETIGIFVSGARIATIAPFGGVELHALERRALRPLDFFPTRGFALAIYAAAGLVYIANGNDGVRIGRVEENGGIEWISHLRTEDARDVFPSGGYLYIANGAGGLRIADIADPANPRLVGAHASPFYMSAVVVRGERAYCAGGLGGAEIVDVSDPRRPRLAWRAEFSEVRGIDADDRWCYIADGDAGLRIYALDGPEPRLVSTLDTPGWNCDVLVAKNRTYLADGGAGIIVADVSNRERPRPLGSAPAGSIARNLWLRGATLFVAAQTRGVLAYDVSAPERPFEAGHARTVNDARGVHADDRFVYVASGSGGVYVFSYRR